MARYDPARFDALRACIVGPAETPYEGGLFFFDVWLPPTYPSAPPKLQLLTTDGGCQRVLATVVGSDRCPCATTGGRFRFNPNLYACGKVHARAPRLRIRPHSTEPIGSAKSCSRDNLRRPPRARGAQA